jgi:hypothetical protein
MTSEPEPSRLWRVARTPAKPTERKKEREERLENRRAERQALRQRLAEDDDAVLTFKEWCGLNGVGERTGRRILASGNGPTIIRLTDKRIGVTRRNNRIWQAQRARKTGETDIRHGVDSAAAGARP